MSGSNSDGCGSGKVILTFPSSCVGRDTWATPPSRRTDGLPFASFLIVPARGGCARRPVGIVGTLLGNRRPRGRQVRLAHRGARLISRRAGGGPVWARAG